MKTIRVSKDSRPFGVAGAIAGMIREGCSVTVEAIGEAAVYRATLATVLAQDYLNREEIKIVVFPRSSNGDVQGGLRGTPVYLEVQRI